MVHSPNPSDNERCEWRDDQYDATSDGEGEADAAELDLASSPRSSVRSKKSSKSKKKKKSRKKERETRRSREGDEEEQRPLESLPEDVALGNPIMSFAVLDTPTTATTTLPSVGVTPWTPNEAASVATSSGDSPMDKADMNAPPRPPSDDGSLGRPPKPPTPSTATTNSTVSATDLTNYVANYTDRSKRVAAASPEVRGRPSLMIRQNSQFSTGVFSTSSGNTEKWNVVASIISAESHREATGWCEEEEHFYRIARSSVFGGNEGSGTNIETDNATREQVSVISDIGNSGHSFGDLGAMAAGFEVDSTRSDVSPQTTATLQSTINESTTGPCNEEEREIMLTYLVSMGVQHDVAIEIANETVKQSPPGSDANSKLQEKLRQFEQASNPASSVTSSVTASASMSKPAMLEKGTIDALGGSSHGHKSPGVRWVQENVYDGPFRMSKKKLKDESSTAKLSDPMFFEEQDHFNAGDYEDLMDGSVYKKKVRGQGFTFPGWTKSKLFVRGGAGLALLLVILCIVFVVLLKSGSKTATLTEAPSVAPSMAPSMAPTFINAEIEEAAAILSGYEVVQEPGSPQRRAVGWMSTFDTIGQSEEDFEEEFAQRYAVIVVYYSLNGDEWTQTNFWMDGERHVCEWGESVLCRDREVLGLDLTDFGGRGPLPLELKLLPLEVLRLTGNSIEGQIPYGLCSYGLWKELNWWDIARNDLTGSIPSDLGKCERLKRIDFSGNALTGSLPDSLEEMKDLITLNVADNLMSGPFRPDVLSGSKKSIEEIYIQGNRFSGAFPALVGFSALRVVHADDNKFSGELVSLLLEMQEREEFTISNNLLTGQPFKNITAPASVFDNADLPQELKIGVLDLSHNQFSGTLPPFVEFAEPIRYLDLSNNGFGGHVDLSFKGLLEIEHFSIANNKLTGQIGDDSSFFVGPNVKYVDISGNQFTGILNAEVFANTNLEVIRLGGTKYSGSTLDSRIGELTMLRELDLSDCELDGTIPTEVGQLLLLERAWFNGNRLTGTIPTQLGKLLNLKEVDFSGNKLSGPWPEEMNELPHLQTVSFSSNNDLSGLITPDICTRANVTANDVGCNLIGPCVPIPQHCG